MPVYTVTTELGRLDHDRMEELARGITAIHGEETGAPEPFDEPAVLVTAFTPDLYVQYFRDLHAMFAGDTGPSPAETDSLMARHATVPSEDASESPENATTRP